LITAINPDDNRDFSKQNYLINQHDISYHYSTSFLVESPDIQLDENFKNGMIGFAPVFKDSLNSQMLLAQNVRSLEGLDSVYNIYRFLNGEGQIRELPYSEEELKYIVELFEDSDKPVAGYFNENATKENFKSEAGKYKYVHLATHSFVNPEKPQFSGIILSQPEDTLNSRGILYSNEIYNLDLDADLVVLSSCESGIGKLVRGEGMMALTRGFLYAGASNIITSLWKVFDRSTSELMKNFYQNVLEDNSYTAALRSAKIGMINNRASSFPINWSGFVLIGR
jgi:CHAT domain-containing protein